MGNSVLVIGASGSGKSTSLRNLDPGTTFIINVLDKPLPFKGYKKHYQLFSKENPKGNYFASDNWQHIIACIDKVNKQRPEIQTLIIDDWQYILAYEFMRRTGEKGFDKFSELAMHGWSTINACVNTRENLNTFILSHSEADNLGRVKCKTIGKMLDEKITIEGLFTTVLHARMVDDQYVFQTQYDGEFLAKSPMWMFEEDLIPNDLALVKQAIDEYYNEGD
jgi:hypothetical protein